MEKSFEGKECGYVFDYFNGECSKKEIKRLGEIVKKEACDVVIGIGGGKIFDTAKAVAYYEKTPVLICPDDRIYRCTVQRTFCNLYRRRCV